MPFADKAKKQEYMRTYQAAHLAPRFCFVCNCPIGLKRRFCAQHQQEQKLLSQKKHRQRLKEKGLCTNCRKLNDRAGRWNCSKCAAKLDARARIREREQKEDCFYAYGGCCACCGEVELLFLGIDHINNDGWKEKKSGHAFYDKLRQTGYPAGFRVLCHNCNLGRHLNGGTCPHEASNCEPTTRLLRMPASTALAA